jgi:F0F1-type ATP synthase assembly protein I
MNTQKTNRQLLLLYAGFAIQFTATLLVMVWLGHQLDQWLGFIKPIFIIIFPVASVFVSLLKVVKDTARKKQ